MPGIQWPYFIRRPIPVYIHISGRQRNIGLLHHIIYKTTSRVYGWLILSYIEGTYITNKHNSVKIEPVSAISGEWSVLNGVYVLTAPPRGQCSLCQPLFKLGASGRHPGSAIKYMCLWPLVG